MSNSKDLEELQTKEFVISLRNDKTKHYAAQIKRNYPEILARIVKFNDDNNLGYSIDSNFPLMVYNWLNDIKERPKCPITGLHLKFNSYKWAYHKFGKQGINFKEVKKKSSKKALESFSVGHYHSNLIENTKKESLDIEGLSDLLHNVHSQCKTFTNTLISFKFKYPQYYKYISEDILNECENMTEKMYCIFHKISPLKCKYDKSLKCKFISFNDGYKPYNSKNLKLYKRENDLNKISYHIENDDIYTQEETVAKIGGYIEELRKRDNKCNNLYISFLKIDPKIIASISYYTKDMINVTYANRIHFMLYGAPEVEKDHIKPDFYSFEVGYKMRFANRETSKGEEEMFNWVSEHVKAIKDRKNLKGKELDVWIPEYNLAIEYDGEYWHNSDKVGERGLLEKTEKCEKLGIELLHVFETEWESDSTIIKSIISSKINKFDRKIYARKCKILEVPTLNYLRFMDENYLGDWGYGGRIVGLYLNDELLSIMSVVNRDDHLLIDRYCSKLNTQVIGGFSKMLKSVVKKHTPEKLRAIVDRRYSNGGMLKKLGFNLIETTPPNKWYFQSGSKKMDTGRFLTKSDNAFKGSKNTILSIHDCGNLIFEYSLAK
jgi:hypothetical protein